MTSQMELDCPICFERFNTSKTPKLLPCQHTVCAVCLRSLNERGRVKCPECRTIHSVPAYGFPINITMQRLLSSSEIILIPTLNVPTQEPGPRQPFPPRVPPIHELQPEFYQPNQLQHYHDRNLQRNHQTLQNAPLPRHQRPNSPTNSPLLQPLPSIQTHGRSDNQPSTSLNQAARTTDNDNSSQGNNGLCKTTSLKYFRLTRIGIRTVISSFLQTSKKFVVGTTIIFLLITLSRFVAGAVKLSSDCPMEQNVALHLFVKSWLGFFFWGTLLCLGCNTQKMDKMDNHCVEVFVFIESLFLLIWLILGTVWTIGFRDEMVEECPFHVEEWNTHFINFARVLVIVDWIGIGAFGLYCCYVQFNK